MSLFYHFHFSLVLGATQSIDERDRYQGCCHVLYQESWVFHVFHVFHGLMKHVSEKAEYESGVVGAHAQICGRY